MRPLRSTNRSKTQPTLPPEIPTQATLTHWLVGRVLARAMRPGGCGQPGRDLDKLPPTGGIGAAGEPRARLTCPVEAHRALPVEPDERNPGVLRGPGSRADYKHAVGNTRHNVSVPNALKSVRLRAVPLGGAHWTATGFKAPSRHRHGVDPRLVARRERADLPVTLPGKQLDRPQSDDSLSPSLRLHSCCMCSMCTLPVVCAACDAWQAAAFSP